MMKVSPLLGSFPAAVRPASAAALPWVMLAIALASLLGQASGAVEPVLVRLMLLSLAPLLGFELLCAAALHRTAAAAALGGGAIGAALALGAAGPAIVLQLTIVVCGAMVVVAAALALRQADRRLDDARAEAAAAARRGDEAEAIGMRLGGAAHDINNLLTVVGGSTEMLTLRGGLPPAAHRDAERACRAAEKALVLGRELLAASRQQAMLPSPINLRGVLDEMRPVLEQVLSGPGLQICCGEGRLVASLPPGAAEQIVLNLAVNACHAQARQVTVSLRAEAGSVVLTVADDGVGMDAETLRRAAQPFFTTRADTDGSGMGLHTVHQIAQRAGGGVQIDSEIGAGTRVAVWLPALR